MSYVYPSVCTPDVNLRRTGSGASAQSVHILEAFKGISQLCFCRVELDYIEQCTTHRPKALRRGASDASSLDNFFDGQEGVIGRISSGSP